MRKTSDKIQTEEQSTKYLTSIPQNCQGHEEQEKTTKLSYTKEH